MIRKGTNIVTPENGPAPAGGSGRCFYCERPIGKEHKDDCPCRTRTVVLKYTYTIVVDVPQSWSASEIERHRNESSWCADNSLRDLQVMAGGEGECLCGHFHAKFLREATPEEDADIARKEQDSQMADEIEATAEFN